MTAETNGNTWDRQTICTFINDLIIAGSTWTKISGALKDKDVHIRRGHHGSQAKTWTAWATYAYYKGGPNEMKLEQKDWPATPKEPKKAGPKKKATKKKATSMKDISPATKKRVQKKVKSLRKKTKKGRFSLDDAEEETGLRTKAVPPASFSVNFTDTDADIRLFYRGPSNAVVREVCTELLEIFNRLNDGEEDED